MWSMMKLDRQRTNQILGCSARAFGNIDIQIGEEGRNYFKRLKFGACGQ